MVKRGVVTFLFQAEEQFETITRLEAHGSVGSIGSYNQRYIANNEVKAVWFNYRFHRTIASGGYPRTPRGLGQDTNPWGNEGGWIQERYPGRESNHVWIVESGDDNLEARWHGEITCMVDSNDDGLEGETREQGGCVLKNNGTRYFAVVDGGDDGGIGNTEAGVAKQPTNNGPFVIAPSFIYRAILCKQIYRAILCKQVDAYKGSVVRSREIGRDCVGNKFSFFQDRHSNSMEFQQDTARKRRQTQRKNRFISDEAQDDQEEGIEYEEFEMEDLVTRTMKMRVSGTAEWNTRPGWTGSKVVQIQTTYTTQ
ncbi:hypothetical protein DFJ43DRAFT_1036705 [Lentinula guzmanii]|uniref:Uncharacterized protein n=1 Tax=Lentinula guzmanii TaxID=2804957 RepID=A0AA38JS96_9AGAR|nr:hypothetical protein DFJ43DRAFT_1036705 [Lentinula guzmanii]